MGRVNMAAIILVVLVLVTCSLGQEGRGCTDGNGQTGRCIVIRNCQPLRQLLRAVKDGTAAPNGLNILRRSVCSIVNNEPLVCCATPPPNQGPTPSGRDLLPNDCGVAVIRDKIIDGEDALLLTWPWIAVLRGFYPGQPQPRFFCGGVLINERYVLTAAHCFKPPSAPTLELVRLGEHDTGKNPDCDFELCAPEPQDRTVEDIILHPEYDSPCSECNDIALLRLSTPVTLKSPFVVPICLPIDPLKDMGFTEEEFQGKFALTAGWGSVARDPEQPRHLDILQQVLLPITEGAFCDDIRKDYPNKSTVFCAGGEGKDTCRGDSGGPLVLGNNIETKKYVVGITSIGRRVCGIKGQQALYTNVVKYAQWIIDTLRS